MCTKGAVETVLLCGTISKGALKDCIWRLNEPREGDRPSFAIGEGQAGSTAQAESNQSSAEPEDKDNLHSMIEFRSELHS